MLIEARNDSCMNRDQSESRPCNGTDLCIGPLNGHGPTNECGLDKAPTAENIGSMGGFLGLTGSCPRYQF